MSYRFTLAAVAAVFALTGCAKPKTAEQAPAFDFGSTRVTVTHIPTKTDDGTKLYVTVDDKDAGALGVGESLEVKLPEGKHKVGGYARSLIGRVSISPVDVTTSSDVISHVTYSVADLKPTFLVRAATPVPKPKSESIPAEPVPSLPNIQMEAPAAAEQTQAATPATSAATEQTQAATPATSAATEQTQTVTPATSATTEQTQAATPAAPATTEQTQAAKPATPAATEQTQTVTPAAPVTNEQAKTSQESATQDVTNLTQTPQA